MKFDICIKNIYNLQFSNQILKICIYVNFFSESCTLRLYSSLPVVIIYLFIYRHSSIFILCLEFRRCEFRQPRYLGTHIEGHYYYFCDDQCPYIILPQHHLLFLPSLSLHQNLLKTSQSLSLSISLPNFSSQISSISFSI